MMKRREQSFLDDGDGIAGAGDLVCLPPGKDALLDVRQLVSFEILERQLIAEAERLAVDEVNVSLVLVLDVEIVAPRQELLLEQIAHGAENEVDSGLARSRQIK
jgi:hypothetical protein